MICSKIKYYVSKKIYHLSKCFQLLRSDFMKMSIFIFIFIVKFMIMKYLFYAVLILCIVGGSFLWVEVHDKIGLAGAVFCGIVLIGCLSAKKVK
jgi:hypothetical protein